MPVIITPAKSIDKPSMTFSQGAGNSGAAFQSAVIGAIQDNPAAIPQATTSLQYSEIAELAQQQDDALFCRLINNNVNCRYQCISGTTGTIYGTPNPNETYIVFEHKDFSGGGMEQEQNQMFFMSPKCGVYRVSFGMLYTQNSGLNPQDLNIKLVRKERTGISNPYNSAFWQQVGASAKFWANGCDLIELDCGHSIALKIQNGALGNISAGTYSLVAWIAINYTGNQH